MGRAGAVGGLVAALALCAGLACNGVAAEAPGDADADGAGSIVLTGTQVPVDVAEGLRVDAGLGPTRGLNRRFRAGRRTATAGSGTRRHAARRSTAEVRRRGTAAEGPRYPGRRQARSTPSSRRFPRPCRAGDHRDRGPGLREAPGEGARALCHRLAGVAAGPLPGRSLAAEGDPQRRRGRLRDVESVLRLRRSLHHREQGGTSSGGTRNDRWAEAYIEPGIGGIFRLGDTPLYPYGSVTYLESASWGQDIYDSGFSPTTARSSRPIAGVVVDLPGKGNAT